MDNARNVQPTLPPSSGAGFCGMMFTSEKPVAEPNSDAIQARQAMAQWDAPIPDVTPADSAL